MIFNLKKSSNIKLLLLTLGLFIGLYLIQLSNYLLFHVLAEMFSIVIAFSVFIIVWNGRSYLKDNFILLYGLAYLFIGFIDMFHTLGYNGMSIFKDYDYYANQFWIAGRLIESVTLLTGSMLIKRKKMLSVNLIMIGYSAINVFFTYSIIFSDIFPECYVEGVGQTLFKIVSEYVIILILTVTLLNFIRQRERFEKNIFWYMITSILFTIVSEFAFIFYIDNYGFSNMIGHYAKILSFYFIYRAIIRKNILEPYDSIFKELTQANMLKTRLFSIIAHDLSGPMSATTSLLRVLDDNSETLKAEDRKVYLSEIRKSQDNIDRQLMNLLEWSRIELSGDTITKQFCDPLFLINDTIFDLQVIAELKDVRITVVSEKGLLLNIDPDSFKVVIRNILSNAIKFSEKSGEIKITCRRHEEKAVISIIDQGVGMDFDPVMFQSTVNKSTRGTSGEKGTGLGLYIINKYTEKNDGILNINSKKGIGTTVRLEFNCSVR